MSLAHFLTLEAERDGVDAWVSMKTDQGATLRARVSRRAASAMGALLSAVGSGAALDPLSASFLRKDEP